MTFSSRRCLGVVSGLAAVALVVGSVRADRITLSDGNVLFGTAISQGNQYWIKGEDGQTRKIDKAQVKSIEKGITSATAKPATPAGKTPAAPGTGTTPPTGAAGATGAAAAAAKKTPMTLAAAQSRCSTVTRPMQAVIIWQSFLDQKPTGEDLKTAQAEMAKWKQLADGDAEKINGKWVGGEERKAILKKADALSDEGVKLLKNNETIKALKKFEECVAVYPNSFRANFSLGYLNILQEKAPEAQKYFDMAIKLQPNSPETMSNLGLLLINKKRYAEAIKMMHKAAEARDSKPIAQNLCFAVSVAPASLRNSQALKPSIDAARLMALKYGIPEPTNSYFYVPLMDEEMHQSEEKVASHTVWNGTGFIVDETGLIVTNRHVVLGPGGSLADKDKKNKTLMLMLGDKSQHTAEVVAVDDTQDLALIRVTGVDTAKTKFPFVKFAPGDMPADGADCTVMGFPMMNQLGGSVKITRGIVTTSDASAPLDAPNVVVDAKVNPGNSGGPMLDRYGNVLAVVSMRVLTTTETDSFGLGISAGNVRKFLAKNKINLAAGSTTGTALNAEEIAAKVKPATVCILGMID